jgi:hypothetical protein
MGDDENAAGRRLGGAYVKRLRMLGTRGREVGDDVWRRTRRQYVTRITNPQVAARRIQT